MTTRHLIEILQGLPADTMDKPICFMNEGHTIEASSISIQEKQYIPPDKDKYTESPKQVIILQ